MRRRKALAVIGGLGVASVTGVSFANSSGTSSTSIDAVGGIGVETTNDGAGREGPDWSPMEDSAGSVDAGTLYGIQVPSDWDDRVWVSVYYDNPDSLSSAYSYLNLNTNLQYYDTTENHGDSEGWWDDEWDLDSNWSDDTDATLTLTNGQISFMFDPDDAKLIDDDGGNGDEYYHWRLRVEDGSYYATDTEGELSPSFFLEVR